MDIIGQLAGEFSITPVIVNKVITLLEEGNTIPFIARYRKEETNSMEDSVLREFHKRYTTLKNLEEKKSDILRKLNDLDVLTEELEQEIQLATTSTELDDLYRPYRPKRRTRGVVAREKGFGPLGELYLNPEGTKEDEAQILEPLLEEFSEEEIKNGAKDVVAEIIGDDPKVRNIAKKFIMRTGTLVSEKGKVENSTHADYFDYQEPYRSIPNHRILALNRGEKEEALKVKLTFPEDSLNQQIMYLYHSKNDFEVERKEGIIDGLKRLVYPAVERELRNDLTARAEKEAIKVFGLNLKPLLMQPPMKEKRILALDPGYRTGCKIAVLDEFGSLLDYGVVYVTGSNAKKENGKELMASMIKKYDLNIVAIGNGTASRETEGAVAEMIKDNNLPVSYAIVNEAGASIYSASPLGKEEFPDIDVTIRGAVSIGRRLQDPLAELVKIEPKHIGVGQYQHDLNQNELEEALDGVVEACVNGVGVNVNTASRALLEHVAGINASVAKNIIAHRSTEGIFKNRNDLKKVKGLGPKSFEQSAGFLRIIDGDDPLDNTAVHPESYDIARKILDKDLDTINIEEEANHLDIGVYTLEDIIKELQKPGRDPRDELDPPILKDDILSMDDLKPGLELQGTVRNVVDFGAFVDIGVKQDGLIHISKLGKRVKHPMEVLQVGDIVHVVVLEVDEKRNRISLERKEILQ
ncbi:MAG: Tex family protein [Tissierellia bacterium]|nr:Tex family protein [Tissierellia bacterium]